MSPLRWDPATEAAKSIVSQESLDQALSLFSENAVKEIADAMGTSVSSENIGQRGLFSDFRWKSVFS